MPRTLLVVLTSLFSLSAFSAPATSIARPVDPCLPTVHFAPISLSCTTKNAYVQITVTGLMSPGTLECQARHIPEIEFASLEIRNRQNQIVSHLELGNGEFEFTLSQVDGSTFTAPSRKIALKKCVTPVY